MTRSRFRLLVPAAVLLILICIPVVLAVSCPAGCSCLLPSEAKAMGYSSCGGQPTVCSYDTSGAAKYCYATTRATQTPAVSGFTGSECPTVSGLALIGGLAVVDGVPNPNGLHCQYSLPGTCLEKPCTAVLRVQRTASTSAARDRLTILWSGKAIPEIKKVYLVGESSEAPDHPYIIFHNDPGNNNPRSTLFGSALLYREYVIQADLMEGYWVASDAVAKSTMTALENGGKAVAEWGTLQHTSAEPGPVDWDGIPDAAADSMAPAFVGALGAFAGIALGAYTIIPPGGFSGSEGEDGSGDGFEPVTNTGGEYDGGPEENLDTEFDGGHGPGEC